MAVREKLASLQEVFTDVPENFDTCVGVPRGTRQSCRRSRPGIQKVGHQQANHQLSRDEARADPVG